MAAAIPAWADPAAFTNALAASCRARRRPACGFTGFERIEAVLGTRVTESLRMSVLFGLKREHSLSEECV